MLVDHHTSTVAGFAYLTSNSMGLRILWSVNGSGQYSVVIHEVRAGEATVYPTRDAEKSFRPRDRETFRRALAEFPDAVIEPVIVTEVRTVSRKPPE